jgi:GTP cyclohydrolase IA
MGTGGAEGLVEREPSLLAELETRELVRELLVRLGEDPGREGLRRTPDRVADSLKWLTRGYRQTVEDVLGRAIFNEDHHNMVVVKDI